MWSIPLESRAPAGWRLDGLGPVAEQDGGVDAESMACFLVMHKPRHPIPSRDPIAAVDVRSDKLERQIVERTPAPLSFMPLPKANQRRLQRLADLQAINNGMELVLLRRQQHECGAQHTLPERG